MGCCSNRQKTKIIAAIEILLSVLLIGAGVLIILNPGLFVGDEQEQNEIDDDDNAHEEPARYDAEDDEDDETRSSEIDQGEDYDTVDLGTGGIIVSILSICIGLISFTFALILYLGAQKENLTCCNIWFYFTMLKAIILLIFALYEIIVELQAADAVYFVVLGAYALVLVVVGGYIQELKTIRRQILTTIACKPRK